MPEVEEFYKEIENGIMLFENAKKVKTLIKSECCNYNEGSCVLLDNGTVHKCPQMSDEHLCCAWFAEAVLPLDKILETRIFSNKEVEKKTCAACGKSFSPKSNKAKYCEKCLPVVKKRQSAERQRKRRALSRNGHL